MQSNSSHAGNFVEMAKLAEEAKGKVAEPVVKNSFNPSECPSFFGTDGCSYKAGPLSDIKTAQTPFGRTAILVCADAYTYDTTVLEALKAYKPQFEIVPWGVAAGAQDECGKVN